LPLTALGSAAITSVPLAPAVVVLIIAIAITHITRTAAFAMTILEGCGSGSGGSLGGERWIQALATGLFVAVRVLVLIFRFAAAVTSVPLTPTIVVVIVAASIPNPIGRTALSRASIRCGGYRRESWIQALATGLFVAVRVLVLISRFTAAVTSVPAASAVIVIIIATFVFFKGWGTAFAIAVRIGSCGGRRGALRGCRGCHGRIQAFAEFAVTVLMLVSVCSAAIAVVPVAAAVIILVVTITILGKRRQPTLATAFLMCSRARGGRNKVRLCWVKALTYFAVTVLVWFPTLATAVTAVPAAITVIVTVVAVAIFLVMRGSALLLTRTF